MLSWFVPAQYQFIVLVCSDDKLPTYSSTRTVVQLNHLLARTSFFSVKSKCLVEG
jgi:hypothetical protein